MPITVARAEPYSLLTLDGSKRLRLLLNVLPASENTDSLLALEAGTDKTNLATSANTGKVSL